MTIANRRLSTLGALLLTLVASSLSASAQATTPPTPFDRFISHFDVGVVGAGQFTNSTSGLNYLNQQVALSPSNTLGAIVDIRYTVSPRVGLVYNYGYARYVDNYTISDTSKSPIAATNSILGVQSKVSEFSLGYVGHFGNIFDLQPFISLGGGVLAFRPTSGGGQGLPGESRGMAYGAVGVEKLVTEHFGLRLQYREIFFGAPDFNTNYLANGARSYTVEPSAGFFIHF